jgi:hypothetical protein
MYRKHQVEPSETRKPPFLYPQNAQFAGVPKGYPFGSALEKAIGQIEGVLDTAKDLEFTVNATLPWEMDKDCKLYSTPVDQRDWQIQWCLSRLGLEYKDITSTKVQEEIKGSPGFMSLPDDAKRKLVRMMNSGTVQGIWVPRKPVGKKSDTSPEEKIAPYHAIEYEFAATGIDIGLMKQCVMNLLVNLMMQRDLETEEADFRKDVIQWVMGQCEDKEYKKCWWINQTLVQQSDEELKKKDPSGDLLWAKGEEKRKLIDKFPGLLHGAIDKIDTLPNKAKWFLHQLYQKAPRTEEEAYLWYKYLVHNRPVNFNHLFIPPPPADTQGPWAVRPGPHVAKQDDQPPNPANNNTYKPPASPQKKPTTEEEAAEQDIKQEEEEEIQFTEDQIASTITDLQINGPKNASANTRYRYLYSTALHRMLDNPDQYTMTDDQRQSARIVLRNWYDQIRRDTSFKPDGANNKNIAEAYLRNEEDIEKYKQNKRKKEQEGLGGGAEEYKAPPQQNKDDHSQHHKNAPGNQPPPKPDAGTELLKKHQEELAKHREALEAKTKEHEESKTKIKQLEEELQKRVKAGEKTNELAEKLRQAGIENRKHREEKKALEQKHRKELEAAHANTKKEITNLEFTLEELKSSKEDVSEATIKDLSAKLESAIKQSAEHAQAIEADRNALREKSERLAQKLTDYSQQYETLRQNYEKQKQEFHTEKAFGDEQEAKNKTQQEELNKLNGTLKQHETDLQDREAKIKSQLEKILQQEELIKELAALPKKEGQEEAFEKRQKFLQGQLDEYRKQNSDLDREKGELTKGKVEAETRKASLEAENKALNEELEVLKKNAAAKQHVDNTQLLKDLEETKLMLEKKGKELVNAKNVYTSTLATHQENYKKSLAVAKAQMDAELRGTKEEKEALRLEMARQKGFLTAKDAALEERDRYIEGIHKTLKNKDVSISDLTERTAALAKQLQGEQNKYEAELKRVVEENTIGLQNKDMAFQRLQQELEENRAGQRSKEDIIAAVNKENAMKVQQALSRVQNATATENNGKFRESLQTLGSLSEVAASIGNSPELMDILQKRYDFVLKEITKAIEKSGLLDQELGKKNSEYAAVMEELSRSKEDLTKQIEKQTELNAELEKARFEAKKNFDLKVEEVKRLKSQQANSEELIQQLQAHLDKLKQESSTAADRTDAILQTPSHDTSVAVDFNALQSIKDLTGSMAKMEEAGVLKTQEVELPPIRLQSEPQIGELANALFSGNIEEIHKAVEESFGLIGDEAFMVTERIRPKAIPEYEQKVAEFAEEYKNYYEAAKSDKDVLKKLEEAEKESDKRALEAERNAQEEVANAYASYEERRKSKLEVSPQNIHLTGQSLDRYKHAMLDSLGIVDDKLHELFETRENKRRRTTEAREEAEVDVDGMDETEQMRELIPQRKPNPIAAAGAGEEPPRKPNPIGKNVDFTVPQFEAPQQPENTQPPEGTEAAKHIPKGYTPVSGVTQRNGLWGWWASLQGDDSTRKFFPYFNNDYMPIQGASNVKPSQGEHVATTPQSANVSKDEANQRIAEEQEASVKKTQEALKKGTKRANIRGVRRRVV